MANNNAVFDLAMNVDKYIGWRDCAGNPYPRAMAWEILYEYIWEKRMRWSSLARGETRRETALHLALYLANWGMFRGSSNVLNTNLHFFEGLVDVLFTNITPEFWNLEFSAFHPEAKTCKKACDLYNVAFTEIVSFFPHPDGRQSRTQDAKPGIAWSTTLVTKILLGVWGQVPAFDRYFESGLKKIAEENPLYPVVRGLKAIKRNPAIALVGLNTLTDAAGWDLNTGPWAMRNSWKFPPGKILDMAIHAYGSPGLTAEDF